MKWEIVLCTMLFWYISPKNAHCLPDFYDPWKTKITLFTEILFSLSLSLSSCSHFASSFRFRYSLSCYATKQPHRKTNERKNNTNNTTLNKLTVCEETYSPKSYRYHPGLWSGKKWSCCKTVNRTAFGCQAATHWTETNNNPSPSKLSVSLFVNENCIFKMIVGTLCAQSASNIKRMKWSVI